MEQHRTSIDSPLASSLVTHLTVADALDQVLAQVVGVVPGVRSASVSTRAGRRYESPATTDPDAAALDEVQYRARRGPCVDALDQGRPCAVPATDRDRTWPEFSAAARDAGIRRALSVPLVAAGRTLATVNLYADDPAVLGEGALRRVEDLASASAVAVANVEAYWRARRLAEELESAMRSRATIEQAKGIVMAQSKVDPDTAFDLLRRASQRENRKLRDVAEELVARYRQASEN